MQIKVQTTNKLMGTIKAKPSKSESVRAIIMAALCRGKSQLHNVLMADDTLDAISTITQLGANILEKSAESLSIEGSGIPLNLQNKEINTGNSGITTHFILPLLGLRQKNETVIATAREQMRARPIQALIEGLNTLGLQIKSAEYKDVLPVTVSGILTGGKATISGVTSQYLSALLFALPLAPHDSEISVLNLQERPYVEITLNYLHMQHIQYEHINNDNLDIYRIKGNQHYQPFNITLPGDYSSASCIIGAAVLLPGEVTITGLKQEDAQGDKKLISILQAMGASIHHENDSVHIIGGKPLIGSIIDASDIPDLLPILAVIATQATGETEIVNVAHARIKETDRIHSMTEGLSRLNAHVIEKQDGLLIRQSSLIGNTVEGYHDHRTVMALSVAGLLASGSTHVNNAEATKKTFPDFVEVMQQLGANMEVDHATH